MKKIILFVLLLTSIFILTSCETQTENTYDPVKNEIDGLILEEQYRSFMFFWETSNRDPNSRGS